MYETELMREILKSPMAQKMIQEISPRYGNAYVFLWLMQAIGAEWDEVEKWVSEYQDQVVPQTATWALPYWEKQYGIISNPEWDDERRRKNILNKQIRPKVLNPKRLEDILEVTLGYPARVVENTGKNRFKLYLNSIPGKTDKKLIEETVNAVIPVRLLYDILYENAIHGTVYVGGIVSNNAREITLDTHSISVAWSESKHADIPYEFYDGASVLLGEEIHVLGGSGGPRKHLKWDGTAWTTERNLPHDFTGGSAVVLDGEIHLLGPSKEHVKWNGSSWESVSTLPYELNGGCAVVHEGKIHILGSSSADNAQKHYRWTGSRWRNAGNLPFSLSNGCAVVHDGEIHILGSTSIEDAQKHWKHNGKAWLKASDLPYAFGNGSAISNKNEIHILGGKGSINSRNHHVWDGASWSEKKELPEPFDTGEALFLGGIIYIIGGSQTRKEFYSVHRMIQEEIYD